MDSTSTAADNPGSDAARALGCTCPVLDNGRGRSAWGRSSLYGDPVFWISGDCPLHSNSDVRMKRVQIKEPQP